jgi:hypothetical protein
VAEHHFITLGAFPFQSRSVVVGAKPRTIGVGVNPLCSLPVETFDYISGFRPIKIVGFLLGVDTQDETAVAHLYRQRTNLKTEVEKHRNTLVIDWFGLGTLEEYTVYKNEDFDLELPSHVQYSHFVEFELTLNCLP